MPKIIYTFCDSEYLNQDNYVDTLGQLQELMDAAIYTIGILYFDGDGDKNSPAGEKLLSPKAAYEAGYECIVQKVKEIQKLYNETILISYSCTIGE